MQFTPNANQIESLLENKRAAKQKLSREMGGDFKKGLLMAVILDHDTDEESVEKIVGLIEGTRNIDINVVVLLNDGDIKGLPDGNVLKYNEKNRMKVFEAADVALIFPFTDIEELVLNGVVPIGLDGGEIDNYNPNTEQGTGFSYKAADVWTMFAAVVRAQETFKFPYDWKHLVRNSISKVS